MRTEEMAYILEAYRTRSISKAAERLSISPQGLGKAIKNAERGLGCTLFERSFQGVKPTPVCEAIVSELTNMLASAAEVERLVSGFRGQSGALECMLGMESLLGSKVEKLLLQYNEKYGGNIRLDLRPIDLEDDLELLFENNRYDYRICTKELIRNNVYETYHIAKLHFHPVVNARSRLCKKKAISVKDFAGMSLVVDTKRPYVYCFRELCRRAGFNIAVKEAYDKFYLPRLLSENDDYIYLGQRADIDKIMRMGSFVLLSMEPAFETNIVLQSRKGSIDPRLLSMIRQNLASFSDQYLDW